MRGYKRISHVCTIHFSRSEQLEKLMSTMEMWKLISCSHMDLTKYLMGHKVGISSMSQWKVFNVLSPHLPHQLEDCIKLLMYSTRRPSAVFTSLKLWLTHQINAFKSLTRNCSFTFSYFSYLLCTDIFNFILLNHRSDIAIYSLAMWIIHLCSFTVREQKQDWTSYLNQTRFIGCRFITKRKIEIFALPHFFFKLFATDWKTQTCK